MALQEQPARIRFESFELDLQSRELRKDGRPVKLQDQPVRLLVLLAGRAGELVTRSEIEKTLWADGEFVEFEHAINTAMKKLREALGDDLENPRFIETLPRKGYRFIAQLEAPAASGSGSQARAVSPVRSLRDKIPLRGNSVEAAPQQASAMENVAPADTHPPPVSGASAVSATPVPPTLQPEFSLPRTLARSLFLAIQAGYLVIYCAALYKADSMEEVLARVLEGPAATITPVVLVLAMCGIAVRLYLLSSVGLNHPATGEKYRRLFPVLFIFDTLWAVSPLLLVRKIGYGLALGAIAAFAYLPFAQRTLMLSIYPNSKPANGEMSRAAS